MRLSAKVHSCDYLPLVRDDWESFLGTGATLKLSKNTLFSIDLLRQQAWSHLTGVSERDFRRLVISCGASIRL